ncbi:aminotransferase class I/II-fold pyridoxal phosphate-dependent enzyme [Paenibacillus lutrae]|uniref:Aminotransferase n=1 Tax=Paenibacillus lutrae TaxID=2078573 RepID=A0A7X3FLL0_9BACL|nr:aminotransferase class I/II-fold pyridoxal phosphate-dependent enzyme [Paenibacillus lutrae]MVP02024.1 aminotransferase class I/II-fold pyridoxal phosphate-dependent enzyme [Paenibacillus lutrae]
MGKEWISPLVRDIPPSGIRAFFDRNTQGMISLGVGEPDFTTPESVREACIRALNQGFTKYTSNAGIIELREEIAHYLQQSYGLPYKPDSEVLVTVGTSEAVDLALRTVIRQGDEVLIPAPSYIAYSPIVHINGGKIVTVNTSAQKEFKLTAEAVKEKLTSRSRVLMLNYPNNPTGAIMTYEDWLPIVELVKEHNLIVISDEVYSELTYDRTHVSIASVPGMLDRTLVINGFSKAFAMTGWRIGYACGQGELIEAMLKIHQYTTMCAPALGQIAALESLRSGLTEKDRMITAYRKRRDYFVKGLRERGLSCHMPEGTFYAFPSIADTGLSSEQFALQLLKETGVGVVPGSVFGEGGEGFVRCSYSGAPEQLNQALERMEHFMRKLQVVTAASS